MHSTRDTTPPQRLVDALDPSLEAIGWGTSDNPRWNSLLLSYDKNFRFLESCIKYDEAIKQNNINEANELRQKLYLIMDSAYKEFSEAIIKNGMTDKMVGSYSLREYINLVGKQIQEAKLAGKHPRELMEIALIKLSILKDLSRMYEILPPSNTTNRVLGKIYIEKSHEGLAYEVISLDGELKKGIISWNDFPGIDSKEELSVLIRDSHSFCQMLLDQTSKVDHTLKNGTSWQSPIREVANSSPLIHNEQRSGKQSREDHCSNQEYEINKFVQHIILFPIIDETKKFRQEIGPGFSAPRNYMDARAYQDIQSIIPFFSTNGSIGYNTILCAVFNDYLPVGFGINSLKVHAGYHQMQAYWLARHDYGHCFNRVIGLKKNFPDVFDQCKNIYFELFNEIKSKKIDETTFKKELLVLFLMVYEVGNELSYDSIKKTIEGRTRDIEQTRNDLWQTAHGPEKLLVDYVDRKKANKTDRPFLDKIQKNIIREEISILTVIESIDFVKPLAELGYEFPADLAKRPWKAAPVLRQALLELFEDFNRRHPNLFLNQALAEKENSSEKTTLQSNSLFQSPNNTSLNKGNIDNKKSDKKDDDDSQPPNRCNIF
jgi:hypothetical protein